ncbi:MAG: hypothetical protein AB7N80_14025 [Bdellovibrionales bacterium]
MNSVNDPSQNGPNVRKIADFVAQSAGLKSWCLNDRIEILQKTDGKRLAFHDTDVDEVIPRLDSDGQPFLQINFNSGKKILLTDNFIGFKPAQCVGLDMDRLPKVVTTPDLISVVEAIEESMTTQITNEEVDVLRRVFDSVLKGGESIGFDLTSERMWLQRITKSTGKASA